MVCSPTWRSPILLDLSAIENPVSDATLCAGLQLWGTRPAGHAHHPELVGVWYTVKKGDTVASVAKEAGVPAIDIVELNGLSNEKDLRVGQKLFLYGIERLVSRIKKRPKKGRKPSAAASKGAPKRSKVPFVWPVRDGVLTSGYGPRGRRLHKGIDIAAPPGTPVYAAASGTVIYSDNKQRGYGNLVIIEHPGNWVTVYAHNRRNLVDEGDSVRQGARIAEVGSTGRSTGPHLHFELRRRGKAIDPLKRLPRKPKTRR